MKKTDFIKQLYMRKSLGEIPETLWPYVLDAVDYLFKLHKDADFKDYYQRVIELAAHLQNKGSGINHDLNYDGFLSLLSADSILKRDDILHRIQDEVESIRENLFKKISPPFPNDMVTARNWLKNTEREESQPFLESESANAAEIIQTEKIIEEELSKLSALRRRECTLNIKRSTSLRIPQDDDLILWPGSRLDEFADKIKSLSRQTNFEQTDLLGYILTGIKPLPIKFRKSALFHGGLVPNSFEIEFFRAPTQEEVSELLKELHVFFGRRRKQLTEKKLKLKNLVDRLGGSKRSLKFWETVCEKWNQENPSDPYLNGRGPRMAYKRLEKYLSAPLNFHWPISGSV